MVIISVEDSIHKCGGFCSRKYFDEIRIRKRGFGRKSAELMWNGYGIDVIFCPLCGEKLAD